MKVFKVTPLDIGMGTRCSGVQPYTPSGHSVGAEMYLGYTRHSQKIKIKVLVMYPELEYLFSRPAALVFKFPVPEKQQNKALEIGRRE